MGKNTKTHRGKYTVKNREKYLGENINNINYRSTWEAKVFERFDMHPNVVGWASEVLSIKYRHPNGGIKSYIPDLFVQYIDANGKRFVELIEIKPYCQTNPKAAKSKYDKEQCIINKAKWKATIAFCKKHNIGFRVMTENDIYGKTKYSNGTIRRAKKRKR